jgi:hypothetical protein
MEGLDSILSLNEHNELLLLRDFGSWSSCFWCIDVKDESGCLCWEWWLGRKGGRGLCLQQS